MAPNRDQRSDGRRKRSAPKVRTGCVTCKKRRVKCDEAKPVCMRCTGSGRQCEGYVVPRVWLFQPYSMKDLPLHPPRESQLRHTEGRIFTDSGVPLIERHGTLRSAPLMTIGSHQEQIGFRWYLEKVAILASRWAAPFFWKELLPQASHANPALKQCLVALSYIDYAISGDQSVSILVDESRGLRSYYRAIEIFNRTPTATNMASLETLLVASTAFWTFDLRSRRPALAALHLQATTRLLKQLNEMQKHKSQLVLDVEEMLDGFAATAADEAPCVSTPCTPVRPRRAAASPATSRHTLGFSESFQSVQHARVSLARCIWALNLARNAELGARVLPRATLERFVFNESVNPTTDFSNPPYSSLMQCRTLLSMWRSRLSRTKEHVPAIEKQILLLHAKMTGFVLWRILNRRKVDLDEDGVGSASRTHEEDETILTGFMEESRKLISARKHGSFPPALSHATGMQPTLGLVLLMSRDPKTVGTALSLVEDVRIAEAGCRTINIIFMGFISY